MAFVECETRLVDASMSTLSELLIFYVHSLGATNVFFAVSAEKMDFRGSEVGSSLKGTAFLSDAWRRVGTLLRPESSAVVCAGGFSHRS